AAGAAGVHLPADGLPVAGARAVLGQERLVGRSVHTADEARRGGEEDPDYLILGTIFRSGSHPGGETLGIQAVRDAARGHVLIIGTGAISAMNAASVISAAADGAAVFSALMGANDPGAAACKLHDS